MKTSDQVEARIEILKEREKKLERALENMRGRIQNAESLLQRTREREKPQRLVQHLESLGALSTWTTGIEYDVKVQVDGEELNYSSMRRPRVLNAKLRVEAEIKFEESIPVLKTAPRIEGGKIWVKEYFIQQMKEVKRENEARKVDEEKAQGASIERRAEENQRKEPENPQEDVR